MLSQQLNLLDVIHRILICSTNSLCPMKGDISSTGTNPNLISANELKNQEMVNSYMGICDIRSSES